MFIVEFNGFQFLFDGSFDEAIDDYPQEYAVSLLPNLSQKELEGSWERIDERPVRKLGRVPVSAVQFDATRRKSIATDLLKDLLATPPAREIA
ncbi:MAG TPA: hypothetical protein VGP94_01970 [Tepidisphaeraceae bacterium]|nr:hypothetical protein [Tepidisphaeraceae bacterium]